MALAWQCAGGCVVAVSAYVLFASRNHAYMDGTGPSAGFLPFWIGLLGIFAGVGIVVRVWRRGVDDSLVWRKLEHGQLARIAVVVAALAGSAAVLTYVGFRITAFAMLVVLLRTFGARSWWRILVAAAVGSLLVFQLFYSVFEVPLPSILGI